MGGGGGRAIHPPEGRLFGGKSVTGPPGPAEGQRGQVTRLLERWVHGDPGALDDLLPILYGELRRIAARQMRQERREVPFSPPSWCMRLTPTSGDYAISEYRPLGLYQRPRLPGALAVEGHGRHRRAAGGGWLRRAGGWGRHRSHSRKSRLEVTRWRRTGSARR